MINRPARCRMMARSRCADTCKRSRFIGNPGQWIPAIVYGPHAFFASRSFRAPVVIQINIKGKIFNFGGFAADILRFGHCSIWSNKVVDMKCSFTCIDWYWIRSAVSLTINRCLIANSHLLEKKYFQPGNNPGQVSSLIGMGPD